MNVHENARLTFARRLEKVRPINEEQFSVAAAAADAAVGETTARNRLGRHLASGEASLADAGSRPWRRPRAIRAGHGARTVPRKRVPFVSHPQKDAVMAPTKTCSDEPGLNQYAPRVSHCQVSWRNGPRWSSRWR